jgi:hypothetical protein
VERRDLPFRQAIEAIDAGDLPRLEWLIANDPELVRERMRPAPDWLRDQIGDALDGFFRDPYLLWFVAEDPVRNGRLPPNIARVARTIVEGAHRDRVSSFQEQIDYALTLVCWSWIARECGVQIELIDVLADAGAAMDGAPDSALVNGNTEAAEHLVRRGAPLTLATSLALGRTGDAQRLAATASPRDKQAALIMIALRGDASGVQLLIDAAVDVNARSPDLYPHATALHQAVSSGSLEAVETLLRAGADRAARDSLYGATPLGWAEYAISQDSGGRREAFARIVARLNPM